MATPVTSFVTYIIFFLPTLMAFIYASAAPYFVPPNPLLLGASGIVEGVIGARPVRGSSFSVKDVSNWPT